MQIVGCFVTEVVAMGRCGAKYPLRGLRDIAGMGIMYVIYEDLG